MPRRAGRPHPGGLPPDYQQVLLDLACMEQSDWQSVLTRTTELAARMLGVERVGIWFFNDDRSELVCEDLFRLSLGTHESGARLTVARYPAYFRAVEESRTIATSDARTDPRTRELAEVYLRPFGVSSMLDAPIRLEGRAVGVICYEHNGPPRHWKPEEEAGAASVADLISLSLEAFRRRRAQAALRESEERLRRIADNMLDLVSEVDHALVFHYVSPSFSRVLGYELRDLLGKPALAFVHPDDLAEVKRVIRVSRTSGLPGTVELRFRHAEGHYVWLEALGNPITDPSGQTVGAVFGARDITNRKLDREQLKNTMEMLENTIQGIIQAMERLVELRDPYTAGHQTRVTQLATAIAAEMGLDDRQLQGVRLASQLHDIGKIYIPADILGKPGRLSDIERAMIRTHPEAGHEVLKVIRFPWDIARIVLEHHERLDGSGYPQGLRGEAISPEAKIIGVADVVEAMSSHRPYRPALGLDRALEEIAARSGELYDPQVVEACHRVMQRGFRFTPVPGN